jgi:hypothetical protein
MPLSPRSVRSLLLPRWLRFLLVAWAWVSAGVAVLVYLLPLALVIIGVIDFFQGESPFRSAEMVPMLIPVVVVVSAVAQGRSWSALEPWGRPEIWRASLSSLLLLGCCWTGRCRSRCCLFSPWSACGCGGVWCSVHGDEVFQLPCPTGQLR